MDQTPREIEAHIDRTRERLGSHLMELEQKVEAVTDWREHFRARPGFFVSAAFVGGATLAIALKSRSSGSSAEDGEISRLVADDPDSARAQVMDLWNTLKLALIGVASTRVKDYICELVPDFDEHFQRAEQRTLALDPARGLRR
jgi:hypothetical protein